MIPLTFRSSETGQYGAENVREVSKGRYIRRVSKCLRARYRDHCRVQIEKNAISAIHRLRHHKESDN